MKVKDLKGVLFCKWNGDSETGEEEIKKIAIEFSEKQEGRVGVIDYSKMDIDKLIKEYGEWEVFQLCTYWESDNTKYVEPNLRITIIEGEQ